MIDKMLDLGAGFDWISPAWALAQDLLNGPSHTFSIPCDCGWSLREVGKLLKDHGVKSWGPTISRDSYFLSVRQDQGRWAQAVLDRAGIPLDGGRIDQPRDQSGRRRSSTRSSQKAKGSGGLLGDFWDQPLF